MKKIIIVVITIVLIILTVLVFDIGRKDNVPANISSDWYEQSATSTENNLIVVDSVKDNQQISSPVIIKGKARGSWFFEGTFPIELVDIDNNVIGSTVAKTDGDSMTNDFVSFTATLEYTKSTSTNRALLVLSRDNPSGKKENERSIFIPVILK